MGAGYHREKILLKVRVCDRREPKNDYLKYYRVVKYWVKRKHNISEADLEMIQFLYTERLFSKTDFEGYAQIMSWDKPRFERLRKNGWINKWRDSGIGRHALYELSSKGKKLMASVYRKLNGDEDFSENRSKNPIFNRAKATYSDKTYAEIMRKINKENKERRLKIAYVKDKPTQ